VGGPLKLPSMCRLIDTTKLYLIFLQETLVDEEKAQKFMFSLCLNWTYNAISSVGNLGGLLVAWNPNIVELNPYLCASGILLTGVHNPVRKRICMLKYMGHGYIADSSRICWKEMIYLIREILFLWVT